MPASQRPTIEINGRKYDAVTGQLLSNTKSAVSPAKKASPTASKPKPVIPHRQGHSIDGVSSKPVTVTTKSAAEITPPPPQPSGHQPRLAGSLHHKTKRSQTLNRAVVAPPAKPARAKAKLPPAKSLSKHQLASRQQPQRVARAAGLSKSAAISKYGQSAPKPAPAETKPAVKVESTPTKAEAAPPPSPKAELIARQLAAAAQTAPEPAPKLAERINNWVHQKRVSSLLASSIAAVLLIGYVTYLNVPRIALRVAASRAGFEAEMPSYSPGGFSFSGPVAYSDGQITIGYSSNTDDRNYEITERETSWDSQTLLDNHVLGETDIYSTYQERGLTVYVYNGSIATWVNGGIWYTISGQANLTTEQLLKIASSL